MKKMILTIMLIAAIVFSVFPSKAWFHPGGEPYDDFLHNQFGPMTPSLLITLYESLQEEYEAFKVCEIDFMDDFLTADQTGELNTLDPNMITYARTPVVDPGMLDFDLNNMKFPTNDVWFRKALAHMFDKTGFVATQLSGFGKKLGSPLGWSEDWYNPYCTDLYPYNLQTAVDILKANGYYDQDADGFVEGPGAAEITILFYARQDDPARTAMGQILANTMEVDIGAMDWTPYTAAVIDVDLHIASQTECFQKVMVEFNYHIYTGAWSFGRDPDWLNVFHSSTPSHIGYSNPAYDIHVEALLSTSEVGDPTIDCTAMYHAYECQRIFADDVGVIPVFAYLNYGAYKSDWENVVNEEAVGPWSWFTFLNTFKPVTTPSGGVRWGLSNGIDSLNPIHTTWTWDWKILEKVYDALLKPHPYNVTICKPWMAKEWAFGNWTCQGENALWIEFKLREDMYWHDIDPKANRQTPLGFPLLPEGAFNVSVTAYDVVFTIMAIKSIENACYNNVVKDVVYAAAVDPYTVKVYYNYTSYQPLWNLYDIGQMPILPKHIWEPIYWEGTTELFDPMTQQCLSGCGPWIFDYGPVPIEYDYRLNANTRYFRYHPVDITGELGTYKRVTPGGNTTVSFYLHNQDFQRNITAGLMRVIIKKHYPNCTWITLYNESVPELVPCKKVSIFNYTEHISIGFYEFLATIEPDPLTGHTDAHGYSIYIWGTIPEDINLDFFVNAKDAVMLGAAFGSSPGDYNWNPACDINGDGFVNAKDAVLLGSVFGWPFIVP